MGLLIMKKGRWALRAEYRRFVGGVTLVKLLARQSREQCRTLHRARAIFVNEIREWKRRYKRFVCHLCVCVCVRACVRACVRTCVRFREREVMCNNNNDNKDNIKTNKPFPQ